MSEPQKGSQPEGLPRTRRTEFGTTLKSLAETAWDDIGEWYSVELSDGVKPANASSLLRYAATQVAADVSVSRGRVWLRFKPQPGGQQ